MSSMLNRAKWIGAAVVMGATLSHGALINLGDGNIILNNGSPLLPQYQAVNVKYWNGSSFTAVNNIAAGVFKLNVSNPNGSPTTGTIFTFCTDVGKTWASGQKYEAIQFSDPAANGVNPPWSAITKSIENASWLYNQQYIPNSATYLSQADKAAGMQLAIWKVLYDTASDGTVAPISLGAGNFQVVSGAGTGVTWANTLIGYVHTARAGSFTTYSDAWLHPVLDNSQGMIYNSLTPIPETTTVLAGALLLLPFAASTIRFVRKNRTA